MNKFLEKYISKISIYDINGFALRNDIKLSDDELEFLYITLKTRYKDLLYNDTVVIKDIQKKLTKDNFNKVFNLYTYYKDKYKNYL